MSSAEKGIYFKRCPCTPGHLSCGYCVLNIGYSCPYACSYCYLPSYLDDSSVRLLDNPDGIAAELDAYLEKNERPLRIGTGEFTDSCHSPAILALTARILERLPDRGNLLLELKTKNAAFDHSAFLPHKNRIIFSFSLNPDIVWGKFETKSSAPTARIRKLAKLQSDGFAVGLHFDPIISFPGWKKAYGALIDRLGVLDPARIAWISLGTLRFKPALADRVLSMEGITKEFVPGKDGKLRYFRDLRIELYSAVLDRLHSALGKKIYPYLCMESEFIWKAVPGLGVAGADASKMLDDRAAGLIGSGRRT